MSVPLPMCVIQMPCVTTQWAAISVNVTQGILETGKTAQVRVFISYDSLYK